MEHRIRIRHQIFRTLKKGVKRFTVKATKDQSKKNEVLLNSNRIKSFCSIHKQALKV